MQPEHESIEPLPGVRIGDRFGPVEQTVTAELNEQYLYAEQDYHPLYVEGDAGAPPLAHPALLIHLNMSHLLAFQPAPGWIGIHARDEVEFLNPAHVGDRLSVWWHVVDLYEKRGRPYWVRETVVEDDAGQVVLRRRIHTAFARKAEP